MTVQHALILSVLSYPWLVKCHISGLIKWLTYFVQCNNTLFNVLLVLVFCFLILLFLLFCIKSIYVNVTKDTVDLSGPQMGERVLAGLEPQMNRRVSSSSIFSESQWIQGIWKLFSEVTVGCRLYSPPPPPSPPPPFPTSQTDRGWDRVCYIQSA